MSNNKLLTILVPTYERQSLEKILVFLSNNIDLSIIDICVADGSSELKKHNAQLCEKLNISYVNYPSDYPAQFRISNEINKITTPYTLIHADDDLVNPNGLLSCLNFLEKNPTYVSAHGKYIGFEYKNNEIFYSRPYSYIDFKKITLDEDLIYDRLYYSFKRFLPLFYAVHRTNAIKNAINITNKAMHGFDKNCFFDELLTQGLLAIQGKIKYLKVFYMAKAMGQSHPRDNRPPERYIIHKDFYDTYCLFENGIKIGLNRFYHSTENRLPDFNIQQLIDLSFFAYFSIHLTPEHLEKRLFFPFREQFEAKSSKTCNKYIVKLKHELILKKNIICSKIDSLRIMYSRQFTSVITHIKSYST